MSESLSDCHDLICRHFQLEEKDFPAIESKDELRNALEALIIHLLDHDFQRLLNTCYKIDIDETTFKHILSQAAPDDVALKLADEVLRREMQKVKTRQQYKNQ